MPEFMSIEDLTNRIRRCVHCQKVIVFVPEGLAWMRVQLAAHNNQLTCRPGSGQTHEPDIAKAIEADRMIDEVDRRGLRNPRAIEDPFTQ